MTRPSASSHVHCLFFSVQYQRFGEAGPPDGKYDISGSGKRLTETKPGSRMQQPPRVNRQLQNLRMIPDQ